MRSKQGIYTATLMKTDGLALWISFLLAAFVFLFALNTTAGAAPVIAPISGEIERLTLDDPADVYSGGVMVVGGVEVILPKNLLIDLPANRLSLQQIFEDAPALCKANGESGLAKADKCNTGTSGGFATLSATVTNAGNTIAGDVLIEKGREVVAGKVTFINYEQGWFRVNGLPGDPNTGVMVRLNDPDSRHTIQSGPGCAGGPNCSPDPRFTLDPDNYTNTFATGYPLCIPSRVSRTFTNPLGGPTSSQAQPDGTGDYLCPATNRTPAALIEPPVADSRRFAPIMTGDSVTAEGNYENINGVRFLSSHTTTVQKALATRNAADQPDYLFLEEVFIEAPAFQNQRQRAMWIGFTTLAPTDVDIWSIHRDPVTNAENEFPLASVQGCDNAAGAGTCSAQGLVNAGLNIFRIRYDVDFLTGADAKLSPCAHLAASRFASSNPGICPGGATPANNFGVLSPIPHEIVARTGHKITSAPGSLITLDINGNQATNGEYLFPLGLNLGGIEVAEFSEIDLNALNTPVIFEGIPWNLDRRLGPSGCLNAGGCEQGALGSFALDPFPYSGLDPRSQVNNLPTGSYNDPVFTASPLSNVRNRIFSYVSGTNFNGNTTVLPYVLGSFPADPALITINPTPALNILPPVTDEDSATTNVGVPVTINVLANDVPVFGTIDPASVRIVTPPTSGIAVPNADGTISYGPTSTFTEASVTFTYTVANNFGSVSEPGTVTVTILAPPVAGNDTASVGVNQTATISILANDTAVAPAVLNPSTVALTTPTGGTATVDMFGLVSYTAPATAGTYTFTYSVKDNNIPALTSNVATVTVTVPEPGAATGVTATPVPISPQPVGSQIVFNAVGSGGSGQYEFQLWVLNPATGAWTIVRPYDTNPFCIWNTTGLPAGTYSIQVWARNAGSTANFEAWTSMTYTLTEPTPASSVSILSVNPTGPSTSGTTVTINALATGGSGTYEYQLWVLNPATETWSIVQPYPNSSTLTWDTTGLPAGSYPIQVWARNAGSTATYDAWTSMTYILE